MGNGDEHPKQEWLENLEIETLVGIVIPGLKRGKRFETTGVVRGKNKKTILVESNANGHDLIKFGRKTGLQTSCSQKPAWLRELKKEKEVA
ncbi:MAG: hypothetical protein WC435_00640 [Candidatus Paceibacterota bacterium]